MVYPEIFSIKLILIYHPIHILEAMAHIKPHDLQIYQFLQIVIKPQKANQ